MTWCRAIRSSASAGSKRSTSTPHAPWYDHRAEAGVEPVRVEQRQRQQHGVVGADDRRLDLGELLVVGDQRPVREHRALRAGPRCPRCRAAPPGRRRRSGAVPHAEPSGGEPSGRRTGGVACERRRARAGRRRVRRDRVSHGRDASATSRTAPGVGQHVPQLAGGVAGVDRHGDQPGAQRAEQRDGEVRGVGQRDRDPGRVAVASAVGRAGQAGAQSGDPARPARPR